jgi:uncharacterized protein (DUF2132 family)
MPLAYLSEKSESLMMREHSNDPLHGITLEAMLNHLVARYGWHELGALIKIRCFNDNPSIKSSLNFLRRTPWARQKVEALYRGSL